MYKLTNYFLLNTQIYLDHGTVADGKDNTVYSIGKPVLWF